MLQEVSKFVNHRRLLPPRIQTSKRIFQKVLFAEISFTVKLTPLLNSLLLRRFVFRMAEASAKRVTGDEPQGTMGRVQTASRLPLRARLKERRLGARQSAKYVDTEKRCTK